jgi:hypothetical protein
MTELDGPTLGPSRSPMVRVRHETLASIASAARPGSTAIIGAKRQSKLIGHPGVCQSDIIAGLAYDFATKNAAQ